MARQIDTCRGRLQVADQPGDEPALVLMHGFPDDSRIYNRLISWLAPRRVVAFDFFGYGRSDRVPADVIDPADHVQRRWTAALLTALDVQDEQVTRGQLGALDLPVTLISGALDHYLNPDLTAHLSGLFREAELHLLERASHWPQWDQPEVVSELIP
jgi:pimeloyl-ACP methyl ester carboxylesterase